jgi:hypothetical protein
MFWLQLSLYNDQLQTGLCAKWTVFLLFVQDAEEHKYRTGQVAYKDRRFKFI